MFIEWKLRKSCVEYQLRDSKLRSYIRLRIYQKTMEVSSVEDYRKKKTLQHCYEMLSSHKECSHEHGANKHIKLGTCRKNYLLQGNTDGSL